MAGSILVKGVITGDDALRALDAGVAGLIVSNHGGRQLDTVPSHRARAAGSAGARSAARPRFSSMEVSAAAPIRESDLHGREGGVDRPRLRLWFGGGRAKRAWRAPSPS